MQPQSDGHNHGMWEYYSNILPVSAQTHTDLTSPSEELETYLNEPLISADQNIFEYWKSKVVLPSLQKLAKRFLCLPPATVHSERLFSTAGVIADKRRNRLDPERVRMLIFLNKNL